MRNLPTQPGTSNSAELSTGSTVAAGTVRIGDLIQMQTRQYWSLWGYVTRIGQSASGGTVYFDGETDDGQPLNLTKRASSPVQVKGHRRPPKEDA